MRKPAWLRKQAVPFAATAATRGNIEEHGLNTVCRSARCPNLAECFAKKVATFMILGGSCSRACGFCAVPAGVERGVVDEGEPERVAGAAAGLGISHVVITSVTRDDLPDGGAGQFVRTVESVRLRLPEATVEVLTPDFRGDGRAIDAVTDAAPDVYNHNIETVPQLYGKVRPAAVYERSLGLLRRVKERAPGMTAKSGIMLGLGETREQVEATLRDLRGAGVDVVTVGQYLRPSLGALPVAEYVRPEVFGEIAAWGERELGFSKVFAGPFVRSSYHAGEVFASHTSGGKRG